MVSGLAFHLLDTPQGQDTSSVTSRQESFPSTTVVAGVRLSATRSTGGGLPGLESYAASDSDDSSNSSSDTDGADGWVCLTTPVQLKLERQLQQKQTETATRNDQ